LHVKSLHFPFLFSFPASDNVILAVQNVKQHMSELILQFDFIQYCIMSRV